MDNSKDQRLDVAPLPQDYQFRIPVHAFLAFLLAFVLFVVLPVAFRIFYRLYYNRRLFIDDYMLIFAATCLAPASIVTHSVQDKLALQLEVSAGREAPPPDFIAQMILFEQRLQIASALVWAALYTVKFAFLVFFHQFTSNTVKLHRVWWAAVVICGICAAVSIPLAFMVCTHYTVDGYFDYCPVTLQMFRERTYLAVTTILDIMTDVGIVCIPVALLCPLHLPRRRKLPVSAMMSLSIFMVIIAIVRAVGATLPNGVIDISWLIFWQGMESAVAVLMVSLLVLKSILGSDKVRRLDQRRRRQDAEMGESSAVPDLLSSPRGNSDVRDGHWSISDPEPMYLWDATDATPHPHPHPHPPPPPPPVPSKSPRMHIAQLAQPSPVYSPMPCTGNIPMVLVAPAHSSEAPISSPSATAAVNVQSPVSPMSPMNRTPKLPPLATP